MTSQELPLTEAPKQAFKTTETRNPIKKIPKIYYFPLVLLVLLIVFTGLRISGSSVGIYNSTFYGESKHDSNLIEGQPRAIRSDEWLVNSQLILAQKQTNFSQVNKNIDGGKDMSIVGDAPYKDWSTVLKPQNLSFLAMPLENAFAFKWWFLLVSLLLSSYFFALKVLKNKIIISIAFSIIVTFNPFVFWWYLMSTIMTLVYGFLIMTIGMNLIDQKRFRLGTREIGERSSAIIYSASLAYVIAAFAVVLYPPFQIPIALVAGAFLLGYFLDTGNWRELKTTVKTIIPFVCAAVVGGLLTALFFTTRSDAVKAIAGTVYPGNQDNPSGGYSLRVLFSTYLQPQLQRSIRGQYFTSNQSESSRFIVPTQFFLFPVLVFIISRWIKARQMSWTLLGLLAINFLFLGELLIKKFDLLSDIFLLSRVSHTRIQIGLGFLAVVTAVAIARHLMDHGASRFSQVLLAIYSLVYLIISLIAGFKIREAYPLFISNGTLIVFLGVVLVLALALLIQKQNVIGFVILAIFGFVSVFQVNPLYRGLGPLNDNKVLVAIKKMPNKNAVWGVVSSTASLENFPQIAGRKSVSGVNLYPNNQVWSRYVGDKNSDIYNRYAHVSLDTSAENIKLLQSDVFVASVACNTRLAKKIDYLLSTSDLDLPCVTKLKTIRYPAMTVFIYKMNA